MNLSAVLTYHETRMYNGHDELASRYSVTFCFQLAMVTASPCDPILSDYCHPLKDCGKYHLSSVGYELLMPHLQSSRFQVRISRNAGNYLCNHAYFNAL